MSSGTDGLPPYQEKPSSTQETAAPRAHPGPLAGNIQTCSISDGYTDHFSITRISDSIYHLSLTVDPTPLYRIELILGPSKVGNVQIFSASDSTLPALAAARVATDQKSKTLPLSMICTSSPTEPDAHWRPIFTRSGIFSSPVYRSEIPVVKVPGRAPKPQAFEWNIWFEGRPIGEPMLLWWKGPLPIQPRHLHRSDPDSMPFLFATVQNEPADEEILVHIRRGAGIDFELSVILEIFLILHFQPQFEDKVNLGA